MQCALGVGVDKLYICSSSFLNLLLPKPLDSFLVQQTDCCPLSQLSLAWTWCNDNNKNNNNIGSNRMMICFQYATII